MLRTQGNRAAIPYAPVSNVVDAVRRGANCIGQAQLPPSRGTAAPLNRAWRIVHTSFNTAPPFNWLTSFQYIAMNGCSTAETTHDVRGWEDCCLRRTGMPTDNLYRAANNRSVCKTNMGELLHIDF